VIITQNTNGSEAKEFVVIEETLCLSEYLYAYVLTIQCFGHGATSRSHPLIVACLGVRRDSVIVRIEGLSNHQVDSVHTRVDWWEGRVL
jgi:hypothetical protein